jgi:pilus assembly protein CpaB
VFSLRRRLPRSSKVMLAVACLAGAASYLLVHAYAARLEAGGGPTASTVVAVGEVTAGAILTEADVDLRQVPLVALPPATLTRLDDALGRLTVTPFVPGEPVTATRLAAEGGPLTAAVPPGQVGVTLGVDAAADGIVAGDLVDVLATYGGDRPYTATVAGSLRVLRATVDAGQAFGAEGAARFTFATTPDVARALVRADATAVLAVVVRGYTPSAG